MTAPSAMASTPAVVIIGAGVGGLAAAIDLARQGCAVTVIEQAAAPGGKMRQVAVDGALVDAGPTVLTMRWIFDDLFADAGAALDAHLDLQRAQVLARHAWDASARLDLHADLERTVDSIGAFAGREDAASYRAFCARAAATFDTLDAPFMRRQRPRLDQLVASFGLSGLGRLRKISPFETLAKALEGQFRDPRLRQLFGRYATYCGSSPFLAPATLMLVAHVERVGVWLVDGGMHALAAALAALAARQGVTFRFEAAVRRIERSGAAVSGVTLASGERLAADAVVCNGDVAALASGLFGDAGKAVAPPAARSLSAVTFAMRARASGFPLVRHNVFFSRDYPAEFAAIFDGDGVPAEPTVYVCAQDRGDDDAPRAEAERLLCLVNAPPSGDRRQFGEEEIARCEQQMRAVLTRCGLALDSRATVVTHPGDFDRLFPGTGGALYGPASHGWRASFERAGARTRTPGLYLAGGSVHPGPGVPMAALSGRLAAAALLADRGSRARASTSPWRATATPGGTSTR